MLEDLTAEQLERLALCQKKWEQIARCCDPVSIEEARPSVEAVYAAAGQKPPEYMLLTDSPGDSASTLATLACTRAIDFMQLFFDHINIVVIMDEYRKILSSESGMDEATAIELTAVDFVESALEVLGPQPPEVRGSIAKPVFNRFELARAEMEQMKQQRQQRQQQ